MTRRTQILYFGHVEVRNDNGEVVGALLTATDDFGPVEWNLSAEAARQFLKAVGNVPQVAPEV